MVTSPLPTAGKSVEAVGLTNAGAGPFTLVNSADALVSSIYLISFSIDITTPDPSIVGGFNLNFQLQWVGESGPCTGTYGVGLSVDTAGLSDWITIPIFNVAGGAIILTVLGADTIGVAVFSLRARTLLIANTP